jgi:hypothetical protein
MDTRFNSDGTPECSVNPELLQPPFEEAPLGFRADELERAAVRSAGLFDAIEPAQQLRARRVEIVVTVEFETIGQGERGLDVARFSDRIPLAAVAARRTRETLPSLEAPRTYLRLGGDGLSGGRPRLARRARSARRRSPPRAPPRSAAA